MTWWIGAAAAAAVVVVVVPLLLRLPLNLNLFYNKERRIVTKRSEVVVFPLGLSNCGEAVSRMVLHLPVTMTTTMSTQMVPFDG